MIHFVVYHNATGAIAKSGVCPRDHLEVQAAPGMTAMEYARTDETHVVDGIPVYIAPPPPPPPTAEEIAAKEEATFHRDAVGKLARVFFNHENRIRALEGKPQITWEQLKAWVRSNL